MDKTYLEKQMKRENMTSCESVKLECPLCHSEDAAYVSEEWDAGKNIETLHVTCKCGVPYIVSSLYAPVATKIVFDGYDPKSVCEDYAKSEGWIIEWNSDTTNNCTDTDNGRLQYQFDATINGVWGIIHITTGCMPSFHALMKDGVHDFSAFVPFSFLNKAVLLAMKRNDVEMLDAMEVPNMEYSS